MPRLHVLRLDANYMDTFVSTRMGENSCTGIENLGRGTKYVGKARGGIWNSQAQGYHLYFFGISTYPYIIYPPPLDHRLQPNEPFAPSPFLPVPAKILHVQTSRSVHGKLRVCCLGEARLRINWVITTSAETRRALDDMVGKRPSPAQSISEICKRRTRRAETS